MAIRLVGGWKCLGGARSQAAVGLAGMEIPGCMMVVAIRGSEPPRLPLTKSWTGQGCTQKAGGRTAVRSLLWKTTVLAKYASAARSRWACGAQPEHTAGWCSMGPESLAMAACALGGLSLMGGERKQRAALRPLDLRGDVEQRVEADPDRGARVSHPVAWTRDPCLRPAGQLNQ